MARKISNVKYTCNHCFWEIKINNGVTIIDGEGEEGGTQYIWGQKLTEEVKRHRNKYPDHTMYNLAEI